MDQQAETTTLPERKTEKLGTHFNEHGLQVDIKVINKLSPLHLREFPRGTSVGVMHFRPEGRNVPQHDKTSESLLFGIEGFQQFFDQIDQNQFTRPDYFYGITNETMANQAKTLGFRVRKARFFVDPLDPEYSIGISSAYEIVAETDLVRNKLGELLKRQYPGGRTLLDVLRERSAPQPSPQSSPKHFFRRLVDSLPVRKK